MQTLSRILWQPWLTLLVLLMGFLAAWALEPSSSQVLDDVRRNLLKSSSCVGADVDDKDLRMAEGFLSSNTFHSFRFVTIEFRNSTCQSSCRATLCLDGTSDCSNQDLYDDARVYQFALTNLKKDSSYSLNVDCSSYNCIADPNVLVFHTVGGGTESTPTDHSIGHIAIDSCSTPPDIETPSTKNSRICTFKLAIVSLSVMLQVVGQLAVPV